MRDDGPASGAHGVCMYRSGRKGRTRGEMAGGSCRKKSQHVHGGAPYIWQGINAEAGKYMGGQYICIPDIGAGCPLSRLSDIFWNRERLSAHMNGADAATVAHALHALSGYAGRDWL